MNPALDPKDPNTWPVADAVPTDVFLGVFTHDCTPHLTDEQKAWPVADAVPTDIFLGVYTEVCAPKPKAPASPPAPDAPRTEQPPQQST